MYLNSRTEWLFADPMEDLHRLKMEILSSGRSLFDLSMINPDISPPRFIVDKLLEAGVKLSNHRYSVSRGIRRLRQAFAHKYESAFGVSVNPETEITVTMGTKDALVNALMCIAAPGERILLGRPSYPAHLSACHMPGLQADFFEINPDPRVMIAEIAEKLGSGGFKAVLINFPNNPTGITVDEDFYGELAALASRHRVFVINDFVYGEMGFDGKRQTSLLRGRLAPGLLLESYSLSKAYGVPGWRVGAVLGSDDVIASLARVKSHIDYGIFLPLQIAASAALCAGSELVSPAVHEYQNRAQILVRGLSRLGWQADMPQAGASVWAAMPPELVSEENGRDPSFNLAWRMLSEQSILPGPGTLFGPQYSRFLRFALVLSPERLYEVLKRLESFGKAA